MKGYSIVSHIKAQIIGNLGQNAEAKVTGDGKYFITFSVAAKKRGKDDTQWFDVTAWGRLAETMMSLMDNNNALSQGDKVFIEGPFELNEYTRQDGTNSASIRVNADTIQLLGSRNQAPQQQYQQPQQAPQQQYQQPQQPQQWQQAAPPQQGYAPPPPPQQGGGYQ